MPDLPNFYHPRTLARRRAPPRPDEDRGRTRPGPAYETWREGVRRLDDQRSFEPVPEAGVWEALLRAARDDAATPGFALVTGEPGAGKSYLLETWQRRWAKEAPTPVLGATVVVLVRLRELKLEATAIPSDAAALADLLWDRRHWLSNLDSPFLRRGMWRLFRPLWLLDGLDELPDALRGEAFVGHLAHLPGRALVTCRSAVAQDARLRRALAAAAPGREYDLPPLPPGEALAFLEGALPHDVGRARTLHARLQASPQLRELAGAPLLLRLAAEHADPDDLPVTRGGFYGRVVAGLWTRRLDPADAHRLRRHRDPVLTRLAASADLRDVSLPLDLLDAALDAAPPLEREPLRTALAQEGSSILRLDAATERTEFLHLTFQEHYLARHLAECPFAKVWEKYWSSPRHEETLALLLARHAGDAAGVGKIDAVLADFIRRKLDEYRADPSGLLRTRRSPLRTVLHVLGRSGVSIETLNETFAAVKCVLDISPLTRESLAHDERCPPFLLVRLAGDDDKRIRRLIARNMATPAEVLERLADDPAAWEGVAGNEATPAEVLKRLADNSCWMVRLMVAMNTSAPPKVLEQLANDPAKLVRWGVTVNIAAPPEVQAQLADEVLAQLADDDDEEEQERLAGKAATTKAVDNADIETRLGKAKDPMTLPEVLERLVNDTDKRVRGGVARNVAAQAKVLAQLVHDPDAYVRRQMIHNPNTLLETLWLADTPT